MMLLERATGSRGHASGALHSRMVENSSPTAKMAKINKRFGIASMMTANRAAMQASSALSIPFRCSRI